MTGASVSRNLCSCRRRNSPFAEQPKSGSRSCLPRLLGFQPFALGHNSLAALHIMLASRLAASASSRDGIPAWPF